jgi:chromatin segregation and condensation protein Rec8/ScpA/Scc1 (kleisin family)
VSFVDRVLHVFVTKYLVYQVDLPNTAQFLDQLDNFYEMQAIHNRELNMPIDASTRLVYDSLSVRDMQPELNAVSEEYDSRDAMAKDQSGIHHCLRCPESL